jgi:hypothetical protein
MATSLLIDDNPLQVLPKLAEKVGLNEAIVLQQLHYWLNRSDNHRDGSKWVFNSYPGWKEQFPFWGIRTIQRTFLQLENLGLIKVGNFNKMKGDLTKWYTVDYAGIEALETSSLIRENPLRQDGTMPSCQDGTTIAPERHHPLRQNDAAITRDYVPEITSETISVVVSPPPDQKQPTTTRPVKSEAVLIEEYFLLATTGTTGFMSANQRAICKDLEAKGMTLERCKPGIDQTIAEMNAKGKVCGSISLCVPAIYQLDKARSAPTSITAYQKPKPFEQPVKVYNPDDYGLTPLQQKINEAAKARYQAEQEAIAAGKERRRLARLAQQDQTGQSVRLHA